jgi:23S rRNA (cytosine1962-C5)-methyltransferase
MPRSDDPPLAPFDPPTGEAWVRLKYFSYHPCLYSRFIGEVSRNAKKGDLVRVYDKDGQPFGMGLWNPRAKVPLRVLAHGPEAQDEDWLTELVLTAARYRTTLLGLDAHTDAYRVIHSDGDRLSGLIIDRYADVLRIEVHSFGIWSRLATWIPLLHELLGTKRQIVSVDPEIAQIEGIFVNSFPLENSTVQTVRIREHGVRYAVNFEIGHKTGFFCDQRENRRMLANFTEGKDVLDLCCYTGGFSLAAKVLGKAADVTSVDLDEKAIEQARQNANLNQVRLNLSHTDAFQYARQMEGNGRQWDVVVLDPPKLIHSREDDDNGYRKYEDLNRLALRLVKPGGVFLSCSCSGMLSAVDFASIVTKAAHREGKKLQYFHQSGPGADHPVFSNCPESAYLKTVWARVW